MGARRTTIYVTDELVATAHMLEINVSEVCQRALTLAIEAKVEDLHRSVAAAQRAQDILLRVNGAASALEEPAAT